MAKYIDREALVDRIKQEPTDGMFTHEILEAIAEIPSSDVAPVVHGRWEPRQDGPDVGRCSACKDCNTYDEWADGKKWAFCPNCGAKMDL